MKKLSIILLFGLLFSCNTEKLHEEYCPTKDLCVKRIESWTGGHKTRKHKYYIGPRIGKEIYFIITTDDPKNFDLGDTFYFSVKRKDGTIENFRYN